MNEYLICDTKTGEIVEKGDLFVKRRVSATYYDYALKDFPSTCWVLQMLVPHLQKNTNKIVGRGARKLKVNELAKELGISRQTVSRHLRILQDKNIIAYRDKNLYMNPFYCFNGKYISSDLMFLFHLYKEDE